MKVKLVSTMALLVMLVLSRGSSVSGRALSAQPLDPLLPVPVLTTAPQVTSIPTPVSTPAQTQEPEVTASSTPTSTPSPTTTLAASPPPPGAPDSRLVSVDKPVISFMKFLFANAHAKPLLEVLDEFIRMGFLGSRSAQEIKYKDLVMFSVPFKQSSCNMTIGVAPQASLQLARRLSCL